MTISWNDHCWQRLEFPLSSPGLAVGGSAMTSPGGMAAPEATPGLPEKALTTRVQPPVICPDHASAATCDLPWPQKCSHLWSVLTMQVRPPVICPDHASAATCDQPAHTCLSILVRQTGAQGTEAQNEPGLPVERKNKSKNWFTTAATQPSLESYRQDAPTRVLNLGVPERCEPWALGWPQHCPDHCLRPTNQSMRKNRIWKSCMPSN